MSRKQKFSAGEVVRHRIDGGFYARVISTRGTDYPAEKGKVAVIEQGCIRFYREEQLRKLTARERGPR